MCKTVVINAETVNPNGTSTIIGYFYILVEGLPVILQAALLVLASDHAGTSCRVNGSCEEVKLVSWSHDRLLSCDQPLSITERFERFSICRCLPGIK